MLLAGAAGVALGLVACGDGDAPRVVGCDDVALSTDSAQPLDTVQVRGLPDAFDPSPVALIGSPEDSAAMEIVLSAPQGRVRSFRVPLHPSGRLRGGGVDLYLTDGRSTCPPIPFRIEPLPQAPGTSAAVLDALDGYVAAQAALFGASREDLLNASPDTVIPPLVPLMIAQAALDHPDNPNSIRRIVRGEAPITGGRRLDFALLDALWAKAGLVESLVGVTEELEAREPLPPGMLLRFRSADGGRGVARRPAVRSRRRSSGRAARFASTRTVLESRRGAGASALCPGPTGYYRPKAPELDRMMNLALFGGIATGGRAGEIFDLVKFTLAVGVGTSAGAFGVASLAAKAWELAIEGSAKLLPRRFTGLDFDLRKPVFAEDDSVPGSWENARVTARSEG